MYTLSIQTRIRNKEKFMQTEKIPVFVNWKIGSICLKKEEHPSTKTKANIPRKDRQKPKIRVEFERTVQCNKKAKAQ